MSGFLLAAAVPAPPAAGASVDTTRVASSPWPEWMVPDAEHLGVMVVRVLLTLAAAWVVQRVFFLLVRRGERWLIRAADDKRHGEQRAKTVGQLFRNAVTAIIVAWAVVHSLEILGWDLKPFLVGASIIGAALGFGAQFLVRDVIAGAFIFIEDQFAVGDTIEVNGQPATVEAVTLRATRLRDYHGRELHVPNGEMKILINHSRGWSRAVVDVALAPGQDLARALHAAESVANEVNGDERWRALLVEPIEVIGFERVGPDGVVLRAVARANPGGDAARLSRELRLRLLQRWQQEGIRTTTEPLASPVRLAEAQAQPPATT
jgi:moderate conductance mechanosensitive channel